MRSMKLRTSSEAPTSSTHAVATCAAMMIARTRAVRVRRPPPIGASASSASAGTTSARATCSAGRMPQPSPAAIETSAAKSWMRQSNARSSRRGKFAGSTDGSARWNTAASTIPATPPSMPRTTFSTSVCCTRRPPPAPSAARRASSRRRTVDRASCRLATLATAVASSSTTAASRIRIAGFTSLVSESSSDSTVISAGPLLPNTAIATTPDRARNGRARSLPRRPVAAWRPDAAVRPRGTSRC